MTLRSCIRLFAFPAMIFFAAPTAADDKPAFETGVFSSSITIHKDRQVPLEFVKGLLEARGYRAVPEKPHESGEFSVSRNSLQILTRDFQDQQGSVFPKMNLVYYPQNGRIENKLGLPPDGIYLEPLLLSAWDADPSSGNPARFAAALKTLKPATAKLKIFTMLSPELQKCAEDALDRSGTSGMRALVALDQKTKNVQVWAESGGAAAESLITAPHPLGSASYPFVYLAALDAKLGISPHFSPLDPVTLKQPPLEDPESLVEASVRSRLTDQPVAPEAPPSRSLREIAENFSGPETETLIEKFGAEKVRAVLEKFHLQTTSLLNLTAAFAAIASEGRYFPPQFYYSSLDPDGKMTFVQDEEEESLTDPVSAFLLSDFLRGAANFGAASRVRQNRYRRDAAAAAGATADQQNAWFVGYTPNFIAGVWIGSKDKKASPEEAVDAWTNFMLCIEPILPPANFQPPIGVRTLQVDRALFQEATRYCPRQGIETIAVRADEPGPPPCTVHSSRNRGHSRQDYRQQQDYQQQQYPPTEGGYDPNQNPASSDRPVRQPARRSNTGLDNLFNNLRRGANNLWRR